MRAIVLIALGLCSPAWGQKPAVAIAVDNFVREGSYNKAVVRVTNSGAQALRGVMVECAFLAKGRAVATSEGIVENIGGGETVFTTVLTSSAPADEARCRASSVRR